MTRARALLAGVIGLLTVAVAAFVWPSIASAHDTFVNGTATCQADGTWTVSWKIDNDYNTAANITLVSSTGGGTITGLPATAAASSGQPYKFVTAVQSGIPGNATSASLTEKATWTADNFSDNSTGSLTFSGVCTPTTPVEPGFTAAKCTSPTTYNGATYTIPNTTGVKYFVNGSNTAKAAGTYPLADNTSVTITAAPTASNYVLTNYPPNGWTYTANVPSCTQTVIPVEPNFTDSSCTAPGQVGGASYTIPTTTGVDYYVNGSKVAAGTYPLAGGATANITTQAQNGYVIDVTKTNTWTYTATARTCITNVTPVAPTFAADACTNQYTNTGAKYTIPSTTGVDYFVDGVKTPAGTYSAEGSTSITVTAVAQAGYTLQNYPTDGWPHSYPIAPDCTEKVMPLAPGITQSVCTGPGTQTGATYTIPTTDGVNYFVDGTKTAAGTYPLAAGTSVVITAEKSRPTVTLTGTTEWTRTATTVNCIVDANPTAPTFTADSCVNYVNVGASYTIPTTTGVDYYVGGVKTDAGTYPATAGTTVVVTAVAKTGYTLTNYPTGGWTHNYPASLDCKQHVTPVQATFTATSCTGPGTQTGSSYTIPTTTGVDYFVGETKTVAGTYPLTAGTSVVITAKPADSTYALDGTKEWTFTGTTKDCTVLVKAVPASFVGQQCSASYVRSDATITVPTTTGITYLVDGKVVTGTVVVPVGGHAVTATPNTGYALDGTYPASGWTYTVSQVPCEVSVLAEPPATPVTPTATLASTGSQDQSMLLLAGGVLVLGLGLVLLSRRSAKR